MICEESKEKNIFNLYIKLTALIIVTSQSCQIYIHAFIHTYMHTFLNHCYFHQRNVHI